MAYDSKYNGEQLEKALDNIAAISEAPEGGWPNLSPSDLVGAVFCGIAAPTTNPGTGIKGKRFYIATVVGTYSNFASNISITDENRGLHILFFNGTSWSDIPVDLNTALGVTDTDIDNAFEEVFGS